MSVNFLDKAPPENDNTLSVYSGVEKSIIWQALEKDFDEQRAEIDQYIAEKKKHLKVPLYTTVQDIEDNIFCILVGILEATIQKAIDTKSLRYHKSPFNAIDFIAEQLWNLNPKKMERRENPTYLFDMEWVVKTLEENPRPYFPFSYIWSQELAATKIQAYMRGHWVRRRTEVQEVRQFWKVLKKETEEQRRLSRLPSVLVPYLPFYKPPSKQDKETETKK